jgi:hypothetical protein
MIWPIEAAAEILRWYRDYIVTASDEINGFFAFLNAPPRPPFPETWHAKIDCAIVWCCTLRELRAEEALAPIRQRFPPAIAKHIEFEAQLPSLSLWAQQRVLLSSTLDGTERLERRPLGLGQPRRAGDIHSRVGAIGTQRCQAHTLTNIPQPDRLVVATAGEAGAVGAERHGEYAACVAEQSMPLCARVSVPHAYRSIQAAARNQRLVRAERCGHHVVAVAAQDAGELSRVYIP